MLYPAKMPYFMADIKVKAKIEEGCFSEKQSIFSIVQVLKNARQIGCVYNTDVRISPHGRRGLESRILVEVAWRGQTRATQGCSC